MEGESRIRVGTHQAVARGCSASGERVERIERTPWVHYADKEDGCVMPGEQGARTREQRSRHRSDQPNL